MFPDSFEQSLVRQSRCPFPERILYFTLLEHRTLWAFAVEMSKVLKNQGRVETDIHDRGTVRRERVHFIRFVFPSEHDPEWRDCLDRVESRTSHRNRWHPERR